MRHAHRVVHLLGSVPGIIKGYLGQTIKIGINPNPKNFPLFDSKIKLLQTLQNRSKFEPKSDFSSEFLNVFVLDCLIFVASQQSNHLE